MLARNFLYFSYLSLIASPYLLAHSSQSKKKISINNISLIERKNINTSLYSKSEKFFLADLNLDKKISKDKFYRDLLKFNKVAEANQNSSLKFSEDSLNINNKNLLNWDLMESNDSVPSDIKWVPIKKNKTIPSRIKWIPIDINDQPVLDRNTSNIKENNLNLLHEKLFGFKLLNIGRAVPTSETLEEEEIRFSIGQVSPTASGYAKGTGNQNYLGAIDYGFKNNFLLSFFYTDADDPLTNRITILDSQPENRWSSYGGSFKWKFFDKPKLKIAIEGSLENWMVQSGGCVGNECISNSSNIFNSNTSMVENNNLVGSISLPIGLQSSSDFEFTISPKLTFLPGSQANQYGEGDFYGNNYGIGFGIAYKLINRLKTFSSYYFPIGDSKNSFDDQLNFHKTSIYTLGMNYSIDSKTNFQAFLTNGFGLSPATSVLSIPSSDEILYGFNIIYTPTKLDNYYYLKNERSSSREFFNGLSVSNNSYINSNDSQLGILYDANGSWQSRYEKALSQRFIVDITAGIIDKETDTNSNFKSYLLPGNTILRGGAKAILYSNKNGNITSSIRGSFGRVLAENKDGYFFSESINTFNFFEKVSFNLNPKIAFTASGESSVLGTVFHLKVLSQITLISETDIPIDNRKII